MAQVIIGGFGGGTERNLLGNGSLNEKIGGNGETESDAVEVG